MEFQLDHQDSKSRARAGTIRLNNREVSTPLFMPVGTIGSVKGIHQYELEKTLEAGLILNNTYHLFSRPGTDVIAGAGGLHNFIGWDGLILNDSGGYQIFSLAQNAKIYEDGVSFQSHIDGTPHFFTPEDIVDINREIGPDFMMALDECPPYPASHEYAESSMHLTHRWLDRSFEQYRNTSPHYGRDQVLFPICQGGTWKDLRKKSTEYIANLNPDGFGIGGLSVGEPVELLYEMTELACSVLPGDRPRYLMGVGTPANLLECTARGIDMFDCVIPTREGRNGHIFTMNGHLNIHNQKWKYDFRAINDPPITVLDQYYSRAYLRHLHKSKEMLGGQIASLNNLLVYFRLLKEARERILKDEFHQWYPEKVQELEKRL